MNEASTASVAQEAPESRYDPLDPAVRADPYPYYAWLRRHAPVHYVPAMKAWAVSRHEDVRRLLLDHVTFSSDPLIQLAFSEYNPVPNARYLISSDPPEHSRMRALVNKAFSRRGLTDMRPHIERTVQALLDRLDGRHEFDFIEAFASPLPVSVVADILGIETERHADFRRWSNNVTAGGDDSRLPASQRERMRQDTQEFRDYMLEKIAAVRRAPQENLISDLVRCEEEGQQLSADEVLAMCVLLLIAGNETTTSLLANTLICLREFPDQEALVRADRSLVPALVDESLRWLSPIQLLFRRATRDTEIAGVAIPKDAIVMPMYASANRDETVFAHPERLDLRRTDLRKHLAFGWGVHMCLGKALSQLEGEIALNALFDRHARIEIAIDAYDWCDAFYLRSPKQLPVRVG
ncbi:MAG: cytochrome P450 [Gammaproteobacteria bacterium]